MGVQSLFSSGCYLNNECSKLDGKSVKVFQDSLEEDIRVLNSLE